MDIQRRGAPTIRWRQAPGEAATAIGRFTPHARLIRAGAVRDTALPRAHSQPRTQDAAAFDMLEVRGAAAVVLLLPPGGKVSFTVFYDSTSADTVLRAATGRDGVAVPNNVLCRRRCAVCYRGEVIHILRQAIIKNVRPFLFWRKNSNC